MGTANHRLGQKSESSSRVSIYPVSSIAQQAAQHAMENPNPEIMKLKSMQFKI